MDDKKLIDTANEPVNRDEDDAEFMDTGVLHEQKPKPVRGGHPTLIRDEEPRDD